MVKRYRALKVPAVSESDWSIFLETETVEIFHHTRFVEELPIDDYYGFLFHHIYFKT